MATNLIPCKSCGKEVAKNAKSCPNCGQSLRMGSLGKLGVFIAIVAVAIYFAAPTKDDLNKELSRIEASTPVPIESGGEIASMFSFMTDFTDIQREQKEKDIKGQIVRWRLPVFDVHSKPGEVKAYLVQTTNSNDAVGAFVDLYPRDSSEAAKIEALKAGDMIDFKGQINGVTMRHVDVIYARLVN